MKKIDTVDKAVALKYDPSKAGAPKVTASGQGFVAQQILAKAAESNVPVYKDEKLVKELTALDIGMQIPTELYEAVAQVLIFIGDLDKIEGYKKLG